MTIIDRGPEHEREVLLDSGVLVTYALYDWIVGLIEAGHVIEVHDDEHVFVVPPCNPDVMSLFRLSPGSVAAVLEELAVPTTIH